MSGAVEGVEPARDAIARAINPDAWKLHAMMSKLRDKDPFHASKLDMSLAAADRVLAALTTPPARSYADGVPLEVAEALLPYTSHSIGCAIYQQSWHTGAPECTCGVEEARAAIRLLSQGEKA